MAYRKCPVHSCPQVLSDSCVRMTLLSAGSHYTSMNVGPKSRGEYRNTIAHFTREIGAGVPLRSYTGIFQFSVILTTYSVYVI